MGAEKKHWNIFLSYSSIDQLFVDWLYKNLRDAGLTVWYDKYEILAGESIPTKIAEGLRGSDFLIVVISRGAVKSNWVKTELEPKILQQIEKQQVTIIPIVLDNINSEGFTKFLEETLLAGKKWIQFPDRKSAKALKELLDNIDRHNQLRNQSKAHGILQAQPMRYAQRYPFGLHGGIDPDQFVIPELAVREVTEKIVNQQSVSIIGARMMGKTSLLKFLASSRYQTYYRNAGGSNRELCSAYLNLEVHSSKSYKEVMPKLANIISNSPFAHEYFQGRTHQEALKWIKRVTGKKNTTRSLWIFLFDEFDWIVRLSAIDQTFFNELRSLPEEYNICFVVASRRKLDSLLLPTDIDTSLFVNVFKMCSLTVWEEATVHTLMFKPYGRKLKIFNEEDFRFVVKLTARHPLLLQIVCDHLLKIRLINKTVDYKQLIQNYMEEAEGIYRYYWNNEINEREQKWLIECKQALSQRDEDNSEELQRLSLGQSNRDIRTRLARLGLLLSETGNIEIPTGFDLFLRKL